LKKRIALLYVKQGFGGVEKILSDLSLFLDKCGYEVYFFVMDNRNVAYQFSGKVRKLNYPLKGPWHITYAMVLQNLFLLSHYKRKYKIDVTISALEYCNILNLINFSSSKVITSSHNHKFQHEIDPNFRGKLMEWVLSKTLKKSNNIISVSEAIKTRLVDHYHLPPDIITTIYNAFDIDKIREQSMIPLPSEIESFMTNKTFVNVSRFVDQKSLHKLILSFSLLANKYDDARLVMVGDGEIKDKLKELVNSLNLQNKVLFTGFLSNPHNIVAKARGFVFTSYFEGFGNVLAEAMAVGTCVISTDCQAGPREIIAPGTKGPADSLEKCEYGILVKTHNGAWSSEIDDTVIQLKEAMQLLIEDEALYRNYKDQSLMRSRSFRQEELYPKWLEIIESC